MIKLNKHNLSDELKEDQLNYKELVFSKKILNGPLAELTNYFKNTRFSVSIRSLYSNIESIRLNYNLNEKNYLFVWIPKTAGTSVYNSLRKSIRMQKRKRQKHFLSFPNRGSVTFGHVSYGDLLALGAVGMNFHENAYKFSFVRNPYSRAVSLFNYLKQEKLINIRIEFEAFLDQVHLYRPPIGLYNSRGISQTNPQSDWLIGMDGKLIVDDIYKVEEIETFISNFNSKFGIILDLKQKYNESKKEITLQNISNNSAVLEKIRLIYKRDFDLFDYDVNSIPNN